MHGVSRFGTLVLGAQVIGLLTAAAVTAAVAEAATIQPTSVTASSEFIIGFDGAAVHTIDGSGLPIGFTPASTHDAYASGNHWTTNSGTVPSASFINWFFAAPQTLDRMYVWNHQSTTPTAANPGYDVTQFDLTLFDAGDNVLLAISNVLLAPDTATSQTILFGAVIANVSRVLFDIDTVQSSTTFTGLAEVAFETATPGGPGSVPEPATMTLLGLSAVAALAARRRAATAR
jgi:hypothetical protein